jgi:hypothetical protein
MALVSYAIGIAIPFAFALLSKWYLGVWGFSFPLDTIGWLFILMFTLPFSALFFIIGSMLRKEPGKQPSNRVE